jgi:hypothetical protein
VAGSQVAACPAREMRRAQIVGRPAMRCAHNAAPSNFLDQRSLLTLCWREMDSNHRSPQEPSRTSESPVDAALPRSVEVLVGRAVLYEPTPIKGIRVWPSQIRRW